MGLFDFMKKEEFVSPMTGILHPMEEVPDPAFSEKLMGDGFAVELTDGEVKAPMGGRIEAAFPTGHAFGIKTKDGLEILIHIGIDTVNLQGKHFTTHVKDGDTVKAGQPLITFELEQVKKAGYDTVIPLVFTDPDHQIDMDSLRMRYVKHGDIV